MKRARALEAIYLNICKIVFFISIFAAYALVPHKVFGAHFLLSIAFALAFALTMACVAYSMRENLKKERSAGLFSLVASAVGFAALQACGLTLACGTAGLGIILLILPAALVGYLSQYGIYIVMASIVLQLASLYAMGCLRLKTLAKIAES
jgi:hypothetical protein